MPRTKHKIPELEALLREAERKGGRVEDPPRGRPFKVFCPCADKHFTFVHRTPSGRRYPANKAAEMARWSCW
jgi:hypothetical protein